MLINRSALLDLGKKAELDEKQLVKGISLFDKAIQRLKRNKAAIFSIFWFIIIIIFAVLGPFLARYNYDEIDWNSIGAVKPSMEHFWGTDLNGRDIMVRVMYGARVSLLIALVATLVSVFIGVLWGSIAGFLGKNIDMIMMRIVDILYALPYMLFVILLVALFGRNPVLLFVGIGAVEWLVMARIVRGQTIVLRNKDFIDAVRVCGLSTFGIVSKHIIPNLTGPVIIYAAFTIPDVILVESFLSYLGLGIQEPLSSLGTLISDGARVFETQWWLMAFPSIVLVSLLMSLIFIGNGLRDAFDPRDH